MTDNIFGSGATDMTNIAPTATETLLVDQLVGEGKKFKTLDDLAKGKLESDRTIEQRNAELAALREELASRVKLEEVLDRLTSRETEDRDDYPYQGNNSSASGQPATINQKQIETLIETTITKKERERTANQNRTLVLNRLKELYGDGYAQRLNDAQAQLGLDKESLNDLAARSPTAFLKLVAPGVNSNEKGFVSPPRSSVTSESFNSNTGNSAMPGSPEYFKRLKKESPTTYWSPKVQNELHKAALKAANEGKSFDV